MTTLTDIANQALQELKVAKAIVDVSLIGTNEDAVRTAYPPVRDAVLRAHPWNCAQEQFELAAMGATPPFDFSYQFTLPTDPWCLRVLSVNPSTCTWKTKGRRLLANSAGPLTGWYIARVSEDLFDPLLTDAIVKRLASKLAGPLGNSTARKAELWREYREVLAEARSIDGMESGPEQEEISSIEDARYG